MPLALQHMRGSLCGLHHYIDDVDDAVSVVSQLRALEAFVVALKRDRKLWVLNFVLTFTVETDPPRAAPTPTATAITGNTNTTTMNQVPLYVYFHGGPLPTRQRAG